MGKTVIPQVLGRFECKVHGFICVLAFTFLSVITPVSPQRGRDNKAQGKFRAAKRGPGFGTPDARRALNGRHIPRTVSRPEYVPPIQGGEFAWG